MLDKAPFEYEGDEHRGEPFWALLDGDAVVQHTGNDAEVKTYTSNRLGVVPVLPEGQDGISAVKGLALVGHQGDIRREEVADVFQLAVHPRPSETLDRRIVGVVLADRIVDVEPARPVIELLSVLICEGGDVFLAIDLLEGVLLARNTVHLCDGHRPVVEEDDIFLQLPTQVLRKGPWAFSFLCDPCRFRFTRNEQDQAHDPTDRGKGDGNQEEDLLKFAVWFRAGHPYGDEDGPGDDSDQVCDKNNLKRTHTENTRKDTIQI